MISMDEKINSVTDDFTVLVVICKDAHLDSGSGRL